MILEHANRVLVKKKPRTRIQALIIRTTQNFISKLKHNNNYVHPFFLTNNYANSSCKKKTIVSILFRCILDNLIDDN